MRNITSPLPLGQLGGSGFCFGTVKVQGKQPFQDLFITEINGPAVGGGYGGIQFLVCQVKPRGALVVKVREGALPKLGSAIGVTRFKARVKHGADAGFRGHGFRVNVARSRAGT